MKKYKTISSELHLFLWALTGFNIYAQALIYTAAWSSVR